MSDMADELRIIATESRLTSADRLKIVEAAEQFELMQRTVTQAYAELFEANQKRVAATERLLEVCPPQSWAMSSGWLQLTRTK